jgi:hypothetical protein
MELLLNFHTARTQPISDLIPHGGRVTIFSEKPVRLNVRVLTNHGQTFVSSLTLEKTPVNVPYDPPWGRDWACLELEALDPLTSSDEPYTVKMHIEKIDSWSHPPAATVVV